MDAEERDETLRLDLLVRYCEGELGEAEAEAFEGLAALDPDLREAAEEHLLADLLLRSALAGARRPARGAPRRWHAWLGWASAAAAVLFWSLWLDVPTPPARSDFQVALLGGAYDLEGHQAQLGFSDDLTTLPLAEGTRLERGAATQLPSASARDYLQRIERAEAGARLDFDPSTTQVLHSSHFWLEVEPERECSALVLVLLRDGTHEWLYPRPSERALDLGKRLQGGKRNELPERHLLIDASGSLDYRRGFGVRESQRPALCLLALSEAELDPEGWTRLDRKIGQTLEESGEVGSRERAARAELERAGFAVFPYRIDPAPTRGEVH